MCARVSIVPRGVVLQDAEEKQAVQFWSETHHTEGTVRQYLYWVRRFREYCRQGKLSPHEELTRRGSDRFAREYRGVRSRRPDARLVKNQAAHALSAWSSALQFFGCEVPQWSVVESKNPVSPLLAEYATFREQTQDIAKGTLRRDMKTAETFLRMLRSRHKAVARMATSDIDCYLEQESRRVCVRTLQGICSSLRMFLRFIFATGKTVRDLSAFVNSPHRRRIDRPPRALPWKDVQSIVEAIRREGIRSCREYATILLLAGYGFGAAEVTTLRVEDVDWKAMTLAVHRPKTGARIYVPLLPDVAEAVATYLQRRRPHCTDARNLFLSLSLPPRPMSTSAVRHMIRKYAQLAHVSVDVIGAHAFRHSYATRQVELGANLKVVGDLLGHRDPESTSVYVRVALRQLRAVALPVPS